MHSNKSSIEENEKSETSWQRHYAALLAFYRKHGTCNVPHISGKKFKFTLMGLGENGKVYYYCKQLGKWLHKQRKAKSDADRNRNKGSYRLTTTHESLLQTLVDEGNDICIYNKIANINICVSIYILL